MKKDDNLYVGFTNNLKKRFDEHNHGLVESTRNRIPFELIYYEAYCNKKSAAVREKYLKSGSGKEHLKNL